LQHKKSIKNKAFSQQTREIPIAFFSKKCGKPKKSPHQKRYQFKFKYRANPATPFQWKTSFTSLIFNQLIALETLL
jgi:hypothetical protein